MKSALLMATASSLAGPPISEFGRKDGHGDAESDLRAALGEVKKFGEGAKAAFSEIRSRVDTLEQKGARSSGGPYFEPSAGSQFVNDDQVKAFIGHARAGQRIGIEVKAIITSATTNADGSAGDVMVPYRDGTYVGPKRRLTIRDLIPTIQVTSGTVEYAKQTGFTNNAATVAEGDVKPSSEIKYDLIQVPIRTLAHWVLASRQILDDAPQLMGLIDTELRYGLAYVEDNMLLNGAGIGTDLSGIYTQATALAANPMVVSSPTKIDVIGAAILQQNLTDLPADGIVINPSDWTSMQLIKDTAGAYILGDPQSQITPRLFGLPVVTTPAMAADKFLVGNFASATLYDRMAARVEVSTEDSDNFRKNLVTILAEERLGLAVKNALGFTKGDFSDAITDLTS